MEEPIKKNLDQVVESVLRHRDFFENYLKGKIKFAKASEGLDTFAFDLNTNTIYISDRFLKDKNLTFKDEAGIFAVLHECEHFLEKIALLKEDNGEVVFEEFLIRIKDDAYSFMDDCIADMRENSAVISKSQPFADFVPEVYKRNLWVSKNFEGDPLHIQFIEALAREFQVKDEVCVVSDEVRQKINEVRDIKSRSGICIIDIMANPNISMSQRLRLQNQYIWPVVEELRRKDIENKNKEEDDGSGEGRSESKGDQTGKGQKKKTGKGSGKKGDKPKETDPNIIFKDVYDRVKKQGVPVAVPVDGLKKAFDDWKKENGKEAKIDKALQEYADKIGVRKEDLKTYRDIIKKLEDAINTETGKSIKEELMEIIKRIISRRKKPTQKPRYPVSDGDLLIDPTEAFVQTRRGNLEPEAWEDVERRDVVENMFGEIEITLVCDRSGSMDKPVSKLIEQRKALVFLLEAVKTLNIIADQEESTLLKPLRVKVEGYSFQSDENDKKPFIEITDLVTEKISIDAISHVSTTPGDNTTDFVTLKAIREKLSMEQRRKIKEGELKKIVIVFTDGGSNNKNKVQEELRSLKQYGVIVIGVGITESGRPALETYAPNSKISETAEKLTSVLFELLKDHLIDV